MANRLTIIALFKVKDYSFITVFILLIFVSCHPANQEGYVLARLADRTCRAISLREQRFALANKIRFTLDSLSKTHDKRDSTRLSQSLVMYNLQKERLLNESLTLADTIRTTMDSLSQTSLRDGAAKKDFDEKLNEQLKEKGCINLP